MNHSNLLKFLPLVIPVVLSIHTALAGTILADDSTSGTQNEVTFDVSPLPTSEGSSPSWYLTFALRAGISRTIVQRINLEGYLEYYQFHPPNEGGNTRFIPSSAKRQDVAGYVGVSLARFLLVAGGVYYTSSQSVEIFDPLAGPPYPWNDSGFSELRLFWTVGVNCDIHIFDQFYMPIGASYRKGYHNTMMVVRVGGAFKF